MSISLNHEGGVMILHFFSTDGRGKHLSDASGSCIDADLPCIPRLDTSKSRPSHVQARREEQERQPWVGQLSLEVECVAETRSASIDSGLTYCSFFRHTIIERSAGAESGNRMVTCTFEWTQCVCSNSRAVLAEHPVRYIPSLE
ncbi:protein mab-21 2 [Biomphalaria glabrata]|nr:protein mab-21 2 [Biomphalaria glabrata]